MKAVINAAREEEGSDEMEGEISVAKNKRKKMSGKITEETAAVGKEGGGGGGGKIQTGHERCLA